MKLLSVRQPWAWAIIHGGKDVENRNWYTNYRGLLAIHAGKAFDVDKESWSEYKAGLYGEPWTTMARNFGPDHRGAIIGIVELYDCIADQHCDSPWKADGYEFWCWKIRNPLPIAPIHFKGALGLVALPHELETALTQSYKDEFPADAIELGDVGK